MNVLMIEDDAAFSEVLKESLEEGGEFKVVKILNNEYEAMQFIESPELGNIDAVLLDLQLPRSPIDSTISPSAGLRLAEALRNGASFYGTMLILTNSKSFADGQRALEAGCDGYLCKHVRQDHIVELISELKSALRGEVMIVSREMRHVFIRTDISAKEAWLMNLLEQGHSWEEIAKTVGYKTARAAATIGDRVFDKLIKESDRQQLEMDGTKKRQKALEIWRLRYHSSGDTAQIVD